MTFEYKGPDLDLVKNAAVGEMDLLGVTPAAEDLVDGDQLGLGKLFGILGGDLGILRTVEVPGGIRPRSMPQPESSPMKLATKCVATSSTCCCRSKLRRLPTTSASLTPTATGPISTGSRWNQPLSAPLMPKSGHMANQHGKAAAIVETLSGRQPQPTLMANTCYSLIDDRRGIHVDSVHRYDPEKKLPLVVTGSGGVSTAPSVEKRQAFLCKFNPGP